MMNQPGPPQGGPPGIPPGLGNTPPPPGGPMPLPPQSGPSTIPQPAPVPTFHDLPSRLPIGVQMLDGASRNCKKALGTQEFIDHPHERAALLAISQDLDNLITGMTRKTIGAPPTAETDTFDEGDDNA